MVSERIRRFSLFAGTHLVTGIFNILAMYGVANIGFVFPLTLFNIIMIYSAILALMIIPIQAGIQAWSLLQLVPTPILLFYYFQHNASTALPHRFLDPVRSRIGLVTVVILLLGALIAWPIYAFYGAWLLVVQFGFRLFALEAIIEIVQGLAVGVSAIFIAYFVIASLAILVLQWRRR